MFRVLYEDGIFGKERKEKRTSKALQNASARARERE